MTRAPKSAREVLADAMTEDELQTGILGLAHNERWRVAHFRPAQNARGDWRTPVAADGKGFPDLVLVREGRLVIAELKAQDGRTSDDQRRWIHEFLQVEGIEVHIWRPMDWIEGRIEAILCSPTPLQVPHG